MDPGFGIIDCHGHIFPPLGEACGFATAAEHLLHQQRAMHVHGNQPYRRASDHALVKERILWKADDPSEAGRARDTGFRVGRFGRFEWGRGADAQYVQFLPTYMHDLDAPPDEMVVAMDYAGIESVVLQNDHIYGNNAEYFADAAKRFPGRFIGLAQVEEAFAFRDDQMAWLERQARTLGMRGLYFTMTGFFRNGYRMLCDAPEYDEFWRLVARLKLPVVWVHSAKSPAGDYLEEMRRLARIIERHPTLRHVLVHGVPTSLYADERDVVRWPEEIVALLEGGKVWTELLYPIAWGGKMPYPYARALAHVRQVFDRFGPAPLMWGSDMPNVGRYCTYRQAFDYLWNGADFLDDAARRRIFRDNALGLFAPAGA